MMREKKILLIFLGLSLLQLLSEISYSIYLNRHWFAPVSYRLAFIIIIFIPVLFLITVVFKYSINIQYRSYAILLFVVPVLKFMEYIHYYFNGKGDTDTLINTIIFVALLFFVVRSIKIYIKHKHRSTLAITLSVLIIRYVLYSRPMLYYIDYHINRGIFLTYYYVVTALVLATSGYVIYNATKKS